MGSHLWSVSVGQPSTWCCQGVTEMGCSVRGKWSRSSGWQCLPAGCNPALPVPGEPSGWPQGAWVSPEPQFPAESLLMLCPAAGTAGQEQWGMRLGAGIPMAWSDVSRGGGLSVNTAPGSLLRHFPGLSHIDFLQQPDPGLRLYHIRASVGHLPPNP